jgi:hypothetical protein
MATATTFHRPTKAQADELPQRDMGYVTFEDGDGNYVSIFMPVETARAVADAFNAKREKAQ